MQAVRIHQFGGPEVLKLETLPDPTPGPGEVVVEIMASSVNPVDYKIRDGGYLPADQLPITLGRDVAGVVRRCAPGVSGLSEGDAVFALLPNNRGGYAEMVAALAEVFAPLPRTLDFVEAAAVPLAAMTAWQGLFDQGGLTRGQKVMIHGGAGGVGHMAVQLAKAKGAEVFATCGPEDVDFVRKLGADHVIDYKAQRFEDQARDLDLVYDLIGGETQDRSFAVLRRGGVLVSTLQQPDPEKCAAAGVRGAHYRAHPDGRALAEVGRPPGHDPGLSPGAAGQSGISADPGKTPRRPKRGGPGRRPGRAERWPAPRKIRATPPGRGRRAGDFRRRHPAPSAEGHRPVHLPRPGRDPGLEPLVRPGRATSGRRADASTSPET